MSMYLFVLFFGLILWLSIFADLPNPYVDMQAFIEPWSRTHLSRDLPYFHWLKRGSHILSYHLTLSILHQIQSKRGHILTETPVKSKNRSLSYVPVNFFNFLCQSAFKQIEKKDIYACSKDKSS